MELALNVLTGVLVVVTAVYAWTTYLSVRLQRLERWDRIGGRLEVTGEKASTSEDQRYWQVEYTVTNVGRGTAFDVKVRV